MNQNDSKPEVSSSLQESLIALLITDVIMAQRRNDQESNQANMRDLVRCVFAGLDGLLWIYREHIAGTAKDLDVTTFDEEVALSGLAYSVNSKGEVKTQPRYLSMVASIRLTARIAQRIAPELQPEFGTVAWEKFQQAIEVRNRITHPKTQADLLLTQDEVARCVEGLHWFAAMAIEAMAATNKAFRLHVSEMWQVFRELESGDADTWAHYRATLRSSDE